MKKLELGTALQGEPLFCRDVGGDQRNGQGADRRGDRRFHDAASPTPWLFIHGDFSDGVSAWGLQLASLPPHQRVLVIDRRGYGESPKEPRPYTIAGEAADALQAADLAGAAQFHLVGHSYGALIALEIARHQSERVASLHLIEPPYLSLLPDDPDVRFLQEKGEAVYAGAKSWGAERITEQFFHMLGGEGLVEHIRSSPAWADLVRDAKRIADQAFAGTYSPAALQELIEARRRKLARADKSEPAGPLLIYTGGRSHRGLRKLASHLASLIPESRLIDIPEASHAVQRAQQPLERALLSVVGT